MFFLLLLFPPAPACDARQGNQVWYMTVCSSPVFCFSCFLSSLWGWCTAWQLSLIQNCLLIITRVFCGLFFYPAPMCEQFLFFLFFPASRSDARRGDQMAAEHDAALCAAGVHEGAGPPHRRPAQRPAQARPGLRPWNPRPVWRAAAGEDRVAVDSVHWGKGFVVLLYCAWRSFLELGEVHYK